MATDKTVATTILEQLGGRQFIACTGSKNFVCDDKSLHFQLPTRGDFKAQNGANCCRVELTGEDAYRVEFCKINARKGQVVKISEHFPVWCDNLQDVFEAETGLFCTLHPRKAVTG